MTPEQIEEWRGSLAYAYQPAGETDELCNLALDGLRFRKWVEAHSTTPAKAALLIPVNSSLEVYRASLDAFIVERRG